MLPSLGHYMAKDWPILLLAVLVEHLYDFERYRVHLRKRGIKARIAHKGVESKERLGRHRWVVERTHAWLADMGKLCIRFERRLDIHQALLSLACSIICIRSLPGFC